MKNAGILLAIVTVALMIFDMFSIACPLDSACLFEGFSWTQYRNDPFCALRDSLRTLMSYSLVTTHPVLVDPCVLLCLLFFSRDISFKNAHHMVWRIVLFYCFTFNQSELSVASQLYLVSFYEYVLRYDMVRIMRNVHPHAIWAKQSIYERLFRSIMTMGLCVCSLLIVPYCVVCSLVQKKHKGFFIFYYAIGGIFLQIFMAFFLWPSPEPLRLRNAGLSCLLIYIKTTSYNGCVDLEFLFPFYTVLCCLLFVHHAPKTSSTHTH